MSKHDELKRLAEAATQGDWTHWKHGVVKGGPVVQFSNGSGQQQIVMTTGAEWMRAGEQYANADFIAAANPSAVLAMIAESDRLECEAKNDLIAYKAVIERQNELRAENAGLRTGYQAYERVNAELRAENDALRKDAERYRSMFGGDDSWDYSHHWCCESKADVDEMIDAALIEGEQS